MASEEILIVDCDTGIDDALALLYLLADPSVRIGAVTTVFGNTDPETAALNTLRVLELAGRPDIPVAIGAPHNLRGNRHLAPDVHGEDGLGNTHLPVPAVAPIGEPAAELIVRTARENPGAVHLLAVGPLTNLAAALELEPELPRLVKHVTIMGGAMMHPGNVTPAAEANISNDPEAARIVLRAGWPVTLVPLDATMTEAITEEQRQRLADFGSPVTTFTAAILDLYLDFYAKNAFGERKAACHDPLAAAIAVGDVEPLLAPIVPVDVETGDGPARGTTVADLRGQYRGFPADASATVRVVLKTDRTFGERLVERLCGAEETRGAA
ncbi:nucleoside hydrolase [Saccharopolyspora sp. WRP15-2]|uniref:Nucleoside hydrolase n=1 Tax=Saccharopolyspora oryzae TaxID=2997343 RepID=A0ABT4UVV2_9PSEU|nr:nucleoside hydrolase [Saccharopolyspora oryzae]MDA3625857.1 nucleoside hydrolase [Saccharopolyspora oryzae]